MPVEGLINCVGADNDEWQFTTRSWSGRDEEYTITISKRDGMVRCTCMDATCRRKTDLITASEPRICKHARAVLRWIDQLTGGEQ